METPIEDTSTEKDLRMALQEATAKVKELNGLFEDAVTQLMETRRLAEHWRDSATGIFAPAAKLPWE